MDLSNFFVWKFLPALFLVFLRDSFPCFMKVLYFVKLKESRGGGEKGEKRGR